MFDGLIDCRLSNMIANTMAECDVTELRMRCGKPLVVMSICDRRTVVGAFGAPYIVSLQDIEHVLQTASNFSIYSINDEIVRGYIPRGNARIGIGGEGICDNGKLITVKNISYLTIRIPHQVYGVADCIVDRVLKDGIKNTLIISPPGAGKTTMLRELARLVSHKFNTLIIDERYEIAAVNGGASILDVGECDVISGIDKTVAYENCVRAMNPEIIVTDEIFKKTEIDAICDIVRSGVKVFASAHGESLDSLKQSKTFSWLLDIFQLVVVLSKTPKVGVVKEVVEL